MSTVDYSIVSFYTREPWSSVRLSPRLDAFPATVRTTLCDRLHMRKTARSILLVVLTLLSAVALGVTTILTSAGLSLAAETKT